MEIRTLVFIVIGSLAALTGGIMMLIAAFRRSLPWGFAVLFLPIAQIVFAIMHWAEAKKGFFVSLGGTALVALGLATSPTLRTAAVKMQGLDLSKLQLPTAGFALQPAQPPLNLDEQIQKEREKIEQLDAKFVHDGQTLMQEFAALTEQRKLLKDSDGPAVGAFNHAVAEYQSHNTSRQSAKTELAALHLELETLLDRRSRQNAAPAPSAKKVVMYTTSTCPACKMAKSYFTKKGVPYEEHDVNSSPEARAEFQKLGGRGVPLILVGAEKMEGFSQQRLDQLL